jgi:hypothetical protein
MLVAIIGSYHRGEKQEKVIHYTVFVDTNNKNVHYGNGKKQEAGHTKILAVGYVR